VQKKWFSSFAVKLGARIKYQSRRQLRKVKVIFLKAVSFLEPEFSRYSSLGWVLCAMWEYYLFSAERSMVWQTPKLITLTWKTATVVLLGSMS